MAEMVIQPFVAVSRTSVAPVSPTLESPYRPSISSPAPKFLEASNSLEPKPVGQKLALEQKSKWPDLNSTEKDKVEVPGRYPGVSEPLSIGPDEEANALTRRYDASGKLLPPAAKAVELFQHPHRGINILA
jgi:hypothetical protein